MRRTGASLTFSFSVAAVVSLSLVCLLRADEPAGPPAPAAGGPAADARQDLQDLTGPDHWLVEKWEPDAVGVDAKDGTLRVSTQSPEHGVMLWLKRELPRDFVFEYDFTPLSRTGFFLVFFCAKGEGDADLLGEKAQSDRTASTLFKKYTQGRVRCYHLSYRRGEEANCNLRKNPGLVLLKQQSLDQALPQDKTVHVKLTRKADRILLEVGDAVFMDYQDRQDPLEGGRLALRQVYDSAATYAHVKLTELK